ncbi:GPO family capsid scaffolding protein [Acinetobacter baumannii]|uniref:GPO family capsid scaffolding protein n=1 Tax=Acinetobacter baumannii TaxID=470 RepID=UPI001126FB98|nr:GPO family capsid scaffolding protein [Acinetobacter baumannii]TPT13122.1 GPO family capsid scaffolding protein [Acinetobacter baumannii]
MSKKSKFYRVAVAGATTDGRTIEPEWIQQMAKNYSQNTYTALANIEHIRGFTPDSTFGNYAKVIGLKAQEDEIAGQKKWALYAQLEAFDNLIEMHGKNQKLFNSIEVNPNFADTNEAYLVGIAFTDTPASLGTQIMEFASKNPDVNPFTSKKQHKDNLFTAAEEIALEFEEESPVSNLFSKVIDWLNPKQEEQSQKNNGQFNEIAKSVEEIAKTFGNTVKEQNDLKEKYSKLQNDFNELKSKLQGEENPHTPPAPENTGNFSEKIEC